LSYAEALRAKRGGAEDAEKKNNGSAESESWPPAKPFLPLFLLSVLSVCSVVYSFTKLDR